MLLRKKVWKLIVCTSELKPNLFIDATVSIASRFLLGKVDNSISAGFEIRVCFFVVVLSLSLSSRPITLKFKESSIMALLTY